MKLEATQQDFIEFVMGQDPATKINHSSFMTCAIGSFHGSKGDEDFLNLLDWTEYHLTLILPTHGITLDQFLGGTPKKILNDVCSDYGSLQSIITIALENEE